MYNIASRAGILPAVYLAVVATAAGQPANPAAVRHDEAIGLDHIAFISNATCGEAGGPSGRSVRVDRIAFPNGAGNEIGSLDLGARADAYNLGQGWFGREAVAQATARWASANASLFVSVPAGAATLRILAAGSCAAATVQTSINGTGVGFFM